MVHTESDFFTKSKPVDIIKAKDEDDGNVYEYSIFHRADIQVIRSDDSTSFTGTKYMEIVTANSEDEKFNLKTGYDEIRFLGNTGNDEVIVNKGESLTLNIGSTLLLNMRYRKMMLS